MSEHTQTIVCHITEAEQVALARVLVRAEAKNRDERESKAAAFASVEDGGFGLDWTKDPLSEPAERTIDSSAVAAVFNETIAGGGSADDAAKAAMGRLARGLDPFAGRYGNKPIKLRLQRKVLAWTLDALNKTPAGGALDFVIAELEDRFGRARSGDYSLPTALREPEPKELQAKAPPAYPGEREPAHVEA